MKLFQFKDGEALEFKLGKSHLTPSFTNAPYITSISTDDLNLYPMDTTCTSYGIKIADGTKINSHTPERRGDNLFHSLHEAFHQLDAAFQELCGPVYFPPDGGVLLLSLIHQKDNIIYGASDASLKGERGFTCLGSFLWQY
jgi:hypothetical protein